MNVIDINIRNKIAMRTDDKAYIVGGNSDYVIKFDFDSEWDDYSVKTARFIYNGSYRDEVFEGNAVAVPPIFKSTVLYVGVSAGDLHTTTPAVVPCLKSIMCEGGVPADPEPDVYAQIQKLCNNAVNIAQSVRDDANNGMFNGKNGEDGYSPVKGIDYFTPAEKNELVDDVFNVLKAMNAFDDVSYISNTKVTLKPGRVYAFESAGDTYKVQLYDQDGKVMSHIEQAMGGMIIYPSSGRAKYISIKEKPSSIGLSDLLNFNGLFDKFLQTTTFNVDTEKPSIYIETVDNHKFYCWEMTGNSGDLQIGTYATKELIAGITSELNVSFLYPLEFDEYAIAIDGVEIDRQSYGGTMRIASQLLKAKNTQIVFYRNGEEVIKARVNPTILNCGMLYAIEG